MAPVTNMRYGLKKENSDHQNAAEEATSNLGSATLDATTVQEDDVGFVTVLPGAENATWLDLPFFTMNMINQARYRKQKRPIILGIISYSMNCAGRLP